MNERESRLAWLTAQKELVLRRLIVSKTWHEDSVIVDVFLEQLGEITDEITDLQETKSAVG